MHSCLYTGTMSHHRRKPFEHRFRYQLFLCYLDMDELDSVFAGRWFWSTSRLALARFRRGDHFGDPSEPLADCVRTHVEHELGFTPGGPVRLLTHLSYFGYVINPVSFHFCFGEDGETLQAVVAEVTNTPWGETHCYVIDARSVPPHPNALPRSGQGTMSGPVAATHQKTLHVSPFMPMDMRYDWIISIPDKSLDIGITNLRDGERVFDAGLSLKRRPITSMSLAKTLCRFPLMTGQVAASIYWQALRLWWKGAKFHPHPSRLAVRAGGSSAESLSDSVGSAPPRPIPDITPERSEIQKCSSVIATNQSW